VKDCNQCGKCCIKYGADSLFATEEEIEMWRLFQPDIHQYTKDGEIWFSPETGARLSHCPFLEVESSKNTRKDKDKDRYTCSIYLNRPEDCRHYPTNISEMIRDECEMIEVEDLSSLKRAQAALDEIMKDSRPKIQRS